ncbi:hypothetical protein [Microbulbifer aggregans]|uniref:hypothetical protein n=1 Tax=Microbulbifer aggregans TaxID=1769779 RepID=UPI001CFF2B78|nr:hypothetical protein [Microbulbifer aggregans]
MPPYRSLLLHFPRLFPAWAVFVPVLLVAFGAKAGSLDGWPQLATNEPSIRLQVAPVEVSIEAPTPLTGNNLQLLLALSGTEGGLGDMKKKAMQEFSDYLVQQVQVRFGEFFVDENVQLVSGGAPVILHTNFDILIRQKMVDIFSNRDVDVEKGVMNAYGSFRYRLESISGSRKGDLREGRVNIADLELQKKYQTRAPKDGGVVEDSTREATEQLLMDIAEEVLDEIEDDLEASSLLKLAGR